MQKIRAYLAIAAGVAWLGMPAHAQNHGDLCSPRSTGSTSVEHSGGIVLTRHGTAEDQEGCNGLSVTEILDTCSKKRRLLCDVGKSESKNLADALTNYANSNGQSFNDVKVYSSRTCRAQETAHEFNSSLGAEGMRFQVCGQLNETNRNRKSEKAAVDFVLDLTPAAKQFFVLMSHSDTIPAILRTLFPDGWEKECLRERTGKLAATESFILHKTKEGFRCVSIGPS